MLFTLAAIVSGLAIAGSGSTASSWLLMIAGVGGLGAMLRARRRQPLLATVKASRP